MKITSLQQLTKSTLQDILNQSGNHLLKQNKRCQILGDSSPTCTWENSGLRCAVGVFMSQKDIEKAEDCYSVGDLDESFNLELSPYQYGLLTDLQEIHDEEDVEDWEECINKLAEDLELEFIKE